MKISTKQGFTLIELLIIIAIIGIISAVVVVNLSSLKSKAQEKVIWHNLQLANRMAAICMFEGKNLICQGDICTGGKGPVETDNICGYSPNWPEMAIPNATWHTAYSSATFDQYCVEAVARLYSDETIVYYSCNENNCIKSVSSRCEVPPCSAELEECNNDDECCGSMWCDVNTCRFPLNK